MPARHRSRQRALQILYQLDMRKQEAGEALASFYDSLGLPDTDAPLPQDTFMDQLVQGTAAQSVEIDRTIVRHSEHWRLERMPAVDRNILRLAIYEMVSGTTPAAVAIDEALELARRFSGDESVAFINGVLDAVRREREPEGAAQESEETPPADPAAGKR
jgi:transcription antitermination protein NusB